MSDGVGAFLGYPPRVACATLSSRKALCFPHHARTGRWPSTERHERAARARSANVQSVRQLLGAGSVSSQTLVGPPVPAALRADAAIGPRVSVWPLSTGFTPVPTRDTRDAVVLAEVWPGVIGLESERHPVRDAAQVLGLAHHLVSLDRESALGAWFAPGARCGCSRAGGA